MSATLPDGGGRPGDFPAPDASPLGPALERLERACPAAKTLFRACSFLGPDDIPVWLFAGGVDELPAPLVTGSRARAEAFAVLTGAGLARWTSPDGISVDPLLQAAVRTQVRGDGRRSWVAGVVRLVAGALPDDGDDLASRARTGRLVPHALAVSGYDEAAETEPLATSWLLEQVAGHEQALGHVADARRLLHRSLAVVRAAYGPEHPLFGRSLATHALLLQDMGEFTEARNGFERALAIGESAYGPDHPEVGEHLGNLAVVLQDLGDLTGARACLERALPLAEAAHGPDHPAVASVLNNLGSVLGDLGELTVALQCLERALAVGEATLGSEHPTVRSIRANRAQLLRTPGIAD